MRKRGIDFLQLLTEIEWYLEGKGLMRMEEKKVWLCELRERQMRPKGW